MLLVASIITPKQKRFYTVFSCLLLSGLFFACGQQKGESPSPTPLQVSIAFKTSFAPIPGGFYAVVELRQGGTLIQSRKISDLSPDANDKVSISLNDVPAGTFSITIRFMSTSMDLALAEATYANVAVSAGKTTAVSEPPVMNRLFDEDRDGHNNVDEIRAGTDPRNSNVFPFRLTVVKTGNGTVTSSPAGINCGTDCTEAYPRSTVVDLTPIQDPGSLFVGWGGECSGTSTCKVVMDTAQTITATFTTSTPTSTTVNLFADFDASISPRIAISGSTVLVTWENEIAGLSKIFLARSTNGGTTFVAPVNISNTPGPSRNPQIAISGSTVLITWVEHDIFLSRSIDGGATFASPVNLSANSGSSLSPQIAISGTSTVLITWEDNTPGNSDIFLARSTDGGVTFAAPVNLSANAGSSLSPQIAISGSTVLVTWEDNTPGNNNIFLARSTDRGATFSSPVNLSGNSTPAGLFDPQIAISGSTVLVTWQVFHGISSVVIARSTDGGATFSSPVNLSASTQGSFILQSPQIVISGSTVLVTWKDTNSINALNDVFLARSTDGGATFASPVNLSASGQASSFSGPQIAISGSTVVVAWIDSTLANRDIFLSRSSDGGATFSSPVNLSANSGDSSNPQIAISGSTALVTWQDNTPGNFDIFFRRMEFP